MDTRVNPELLFHTMEEIPRKKFMEMGLVEGEAPARVIASFASFKLLENLVVAQQIPTTKPKLHDSEWQGSY